MKAVSMPVVYVAGRYRGPTEWDVSLHIHEARLLGMAVAKEGGSPLIPQSNTSFMGGALPDQFWLDATLAQLRKCDAVITVHNWRESTGAQAEVLEALRLGIPVFHELGALAEWLDWQRKLAEAR